MIILGTNSIKDTGYNVDNSCRFDGTSSYMTKTLGTPTSAKKGTISYWFKQGSVRTGVIKTAFSFGSEYGAINYDTGTTRGFEINLSNGNGWYKGTNTGFTAADPTAWWHLMVVVDTTQGTEANRFKFYMNGSQITFTSGNIFPSSNGDIPGWASGQVMQVGRRSTGSANYFDGYMAEVVFIDGSALTPSDFGEYDSDSPTIWKPKDVSGLTFGNNGFYLDFEDSSNLGNDVWGGTDLTETGIAAINQVTDTPTNNFCTLNPLANYYNASTFSEGNLQIVTHASNEAYNTGTIGVASGKWYWEVKVTSAQPYEYIGISDRTANASDFSAWTNSNGAVAYYSNNGDYRKGSAGSNTSYGNSYGTNDIVGIALDVDNMKIYFSKNGTWQNSGDPTSGATGTGAISLNTPIINDGVLYPALGEIYTATSTFQLNFGSPPFSISSGNADGNGYGNFEYSVPSGYYALCTKNLSEFG